MNKKYNKRLRATFLVFLLGMSPMVMAQAVIFPQEAQPGVAVAQQSGDSFVLKNDLLKASFTKQDGKLKFDGCEELNLLPSDNLFKVKLADGTVALSSEMTLNDVRVVELHGNPDAVKGSERFAGKAIEADYVFGNLSITWTAVLRNGSHYLRTNMELTASSDVAMSEITPMLYSVDNTKCGKAPTVVGNTRGAILANDMIFAGLETPMGINSAGSVNDLASFSYDSWTENSFAWSPGEETPKQILANGYTADQVVGTRGYLKFKESGENKITFQYASGTHRLNIAGVDVLDLDGNVVASDYHYGYTGNAKLDNVYTLNIPAKGCYMVRYFIETKTETITSSGNISYDKKVAVPVIVYDLMTENNAKHAAVKKSKKAKTAKKVLSANTIGEDDVITDNWTASQWQTLDNVPSRIVELGFSNPNVKYASQPLGVTSETGNLSVEFTYASGSHRLNIVGVDLIDNEGNAAVYDYHIGYTGSAKDANVYNLKIPYAGNYQLRYLVEDASETITSSGNIKLQLAVADTVHLAAPVTSPITGLWRRNTTLAAGKSWEVSAVVGLIAEGQARRSVASYVERERAVPWRAFPIYNSWYELNIDRNNDINYTTNMNVDQCTDVVNQWKEKLYDKYGTGIEAFVWDDGWDQYGPWTFNKNFPNGFDEPDAAAKSMQSGIGCWLGPVGGYGQSGNYRRSYWSGKGGMQLSNPEYYSVFYNACSGMINDYDFRFFKFDGISAQFSSVGPDAGTTGEENAEGIINAEAELRRVKPDIFFNTTVGTWASPFWFKYTDAVWRQENDYGTIGNQGSDREKWITYRDRLVYQNFVKNSPLCPINCLMTHGFILTSHGATSTNMNYDGIVREMRCAFACGSGMVELYCDYDLMNSVNGGALWSDLADCIKWQKKNEDVLPDAHWVGGNPWTGSKCEVYGWASWNGKKATLALRNGAATTQTFKTTLRAALDIPAYVNTSITLTDAFVQAALPGLDINEPIDIDTELTLKLPGSSVFVFDGVDGDGDASGITSIEVGTNTVRDDNRIFDLNGRLLPEMQTGINIVGGKKVLCRE